jgi:hypothetical protein
MLIAETFVRSINIAGLDTDAPLRKSEVNALVTYNDAVFISYGFDWKRTWSAGIYLKSIYSNIAAYTNQFTLFIGSTQVLMGFRCLKR